MCYPQPKKSHQKNCNKIFLLIIFSYLCLPKKRGAQICAGFNRKFLESKNAEVAQLVEQLICNQ